MGTLLHFKPSAKLGSSGAADNQGTCEIVIFPGVRIERHERNDLDLSHRLLDSAGRGDLGGAGHRPRKTS